MLIMNSDEELILKMKLDNLGVPECPSNRRRKNMSQRLCAAEFIGLGTEQALLVLRAFAYSFPSLETIPWSRVLRATDFLSWSSPENKEVIISLDEVQRGLDLAGIFVDKVDPDDPDSQGGTTDWSGWFQVDGATISVFPYVGDRWVMVSRCNDHPGSREWSIKVDYSCRPSRRAAAHLIELIEKGIVAPTTVQWE